MAKKVKNTKKEVITPVVETVKEEIVETQEIVNETVEDMEIIDQDKATVIIEGKLETEDANTEEIQPAYVPTIAVIDDIIEDVIEVEPKDENNFSRYLNRTFGYSWNGQEYEF